MADPIKQQSICPGCSKRTDNKAHCKYPSNPEFNAANPVKRDPKLTTPVQLARRIRANAISLANGTV